MEYGQDNDAIPICAEINVIGETIGNNSPDIAANNSKLERMAGCQRYTALNLGNELNAEAKAFAFVPRAGFDKLCTGGTMK